MIHYHRLYQLLEVWAGIVLALTLVFWIFGETQNNSFGFRAEEVCALARPGVTLHEVLEATHSHSDPIYESLHENILTFGGGGQNTCDIGFQDGRVISHGVSPELTEAHHEESR